MQYLYKDIFMWLARDFATSGAGYSGNLALEEGDTGAVSRVIASSCELAVICALQRPYRRISSPLF